MATANRIRKDLKGYVPGTHLYRLSEPLQGATFVAVMAVDNPGTQNDETIIVAADKDGAAFSLNRLAGSVVGWADHAKALQIAGYELGEDDLATDEPPSGYQDAAVF